MYLSSRRARFALRTRCACAAAGHPVSSPRPRRQKRRGNIVVTSAFLLIVMMGLLAFSIDMGMLYLARNELQRSADAAAVAAAWELIDEDAPAGNGNPALCEENARDTAGEFALLNQVLGDAPKLDATDIEVGYLASPSQSATTLDMSGANAPNTVHVTVRRTSAQNGEIPLFFARALGLDRVAVEAEATASVLTNFGGFKTPSGGGNLPILPFALDLQSWNALVNGVGTDNWSYDDTWGVTNGKDGILEVNLYPQGTGSPGNRGTVDIGSSNNSTSDLARQIIDGVSPGDLEYHGGKLELGEDGKLLLNGDTGISAGIKEELQSIIGKPRIIPIFASVAGPGNNATYTIVEFAGVRVVDVKLTGSMSSKRVMVQPCPVVTRGGIPNPDSQTSWFVYSPAWLVR